jgi:hypothetical protein
MHKILKGLKLDFYLIGKEESAFHAKLENVGDKKPQISANSVKLVQLN